MIAQPFSDERVVVPGIMRSVVFPPCYTCRMLTTKYIDISRFSVKPINVGTPNVKMKPSYYKINRKVQNCRICAISMQFQRYFNSENSCTLAFLFNSLTRDANQFTLTRSKIEVCFLSIGIGTPASTDFANFVSLNRKEKPDGILPLYIQTLSPIASLDKITTFF